ncbi:MAG: pyridoxal kinase PdxY [Treponema sp.]|jgi:pyridoxine kinase|nr:pyridoxal kinase PdxY [Treponema sp.]
MAVLSIQSHVVFGYAGNTAAVFPMQRLGREVWAINTVEFSNHTGYGAWRGKVLGAELAAELVAGIEERGVLNRAEAVLSGYLGDAAVGRAIIDAVKKVRRESPNALYCCDPVMGDVGRGFYVKPDIPDIFKNELVPLADIICPNQFELEALTGIDTAAVDNAIKAVNILHETGPSIVLVTSFKEKDGELSMLASDKKNVYKVTTPELPLGSGVAGTGDMTASVFLSRYLETRNLEKTLELCAASVFGVLHASFAAASSSSIKSNLPMELKIIDAQQELVSPSHSFRAVKIK